MVSSNRHDRSTRSATAETAVYNPSPDEFYRAASAVRVGNLWAQQQRAQKLTEYCEETVAEIRASLERTKPRAAKARHRKAS